MAKQGTYEVGEEIVVIATGVRGEVVDQLGANYEVKHPGSVKTLFYCFKELVSVKNGR